MTAATGRRGGLGRDYRRLFAASAVSNLGDGIGMVAYPWLASALTRNPVLISLVVVVQRLPWLIFSLPAGVITDRYDRSRLMIGSNLARAGLTVVVALLVLSRQSSLPGPDELDADAGVVEGTDLPLYLLVLAAIALLGIGEVLYDNAAQTFMPRIVASANLEKANGRLWSIEQIANSFAGPPLGAWLLLGVFALPFFVDAATFAVSAALIALIGASGATTGPRGVEGAGGVAGIDGEEARRGWLVDMKEGFSWLWGHELLRTLAIVLGLLNMLFTMGFASLVLFAQEELGTSPAQFALLTVGIAVGAVIGGWATPAVSGRFGPGPTLWLTLFSGGAAAVIVGLSSSWIVVMIVFGLSSLLGVGWNVITVSLRQAIIPDHLLGRVNAVYRFFGWGMMPIGALAGGLLMAGVEAAGSRSLALRSPWLVTGAAQLILLAVAAPKLTTARIAEARRAADTGAG